MAMAVFKNYEILILLNEWFYRVKNIYKEEYIRVSFLCMLIDDEILIFKSNKIQKNYG